MWALANTIHLLNQTWGDLPIAGWINLLAALWLLARPSSAHRLALLAAAQVLETMVRLPIPPDHQLLAAFINVLILWTYFRMRRPHHVDDLVDRVAPGAKLVLLVAYTAAATAKYNHDFVTTAHSCATEIAERASFGSVDRGASYAAIFVVGSIASETLVPLLLLWRRTRRWGVLYACTFHFLVSLSPLIAVGDFTATLWALFPLFLQRADVEELASGMIRGMRKSAIVRQLSERRPATLIIVAVGFIAVLAHVADGRIVFGCVWVFVTLYGINLLVNLARTLMSARRAPEPIGRLNYAHGVAGLLMFALVASPYLGLGTSGRFTMFSGLRTEGPGTNHLFLPSVHVIDSQNKWLIVDDLILGDDSESVRSATDEIVKVHAAVPIAELRRGLADFSHGGTFSTPDGRKIVVVPGKNHPLRGHTRWWEAKTQVYRPFSVEGITTPGFCSN